MKHKLLTTLLLFGTLLVFSPSTVRALDFTPFLIALPEEVVDKAEISEERVSFNRHPCPVRKTISRFRTFEEWWQGGTEFEFAVPNYFFSVVRQEVEWEPILGFRAMR